MQASKRGATDTHQKHWIRGLFLVAIWLLTISMIRDFWETKKGFLRIKETEKRLVEVKKESLELNKSMELVTSKDFRDKLIREKLNMQRSDEVVVILPGRIKQAIRYDLETPQLKNWEKWLEVMGLFGY